MRVRQKPEEGWQSNGGGVGREAQATPTGSSMKSESGEPLENSSSAVFVKTSGAACSRPLGLLTANLLPSWKAVLERVIKLSLEIPAVCMQLCLNCTWSPGRCRS